MKLDLVKQLKMADSETFRKGRLSDRIAMLGIPDGEMTPAVKLAVSALLEKLEDMGSDLTRTKENLAEMERLVDVDCVAPIPNRRAFMRRLSWAITMHERYGHPSTILYFDVNDFKQINDLHGHAAGDLAIRHIAQILGDVMRGSDFLARIGGDEFAVIMYHADEEAARKRGMLVTQKIRSTSFEFAGKLITISCAHGCYCIRNGDNAESALAAADMSMYVDKKRIKSRTA
jgi:diguanylate cyclase (GGDEF)-like protein